MHFRIVRRVGVFVMNADSYACRAREIRFRKDCVVVEEVEQIVLWFFYLKYGWAVGACLRS